MNQEIVKNWINFTSFHVIFQDSQLTEIQKRPVKLQTTGNFFENVITAQFSKESKSRQPQMTDLAKLLLPGPKKQTPRLIQFDCFFIICRLLYLIYGTPEYFLFNYSHLIKVVWQLRRSLSTFESFHFCNLTGQEALTRLDGLQAILNKKRETYYVYFYYIKTLTQNCWYYTSSKFLMQFVKKIARKTVCQSLWRAIRLSLQRAIKEALQKVMQTKKYLC